MKDELITCSEYELFVKFNFLGDPELSLFPFQRGVRAKFPERLQSAPRVLKNYNRYNFRPPEEKLLIEPPDPIKFIPGPDPDPEAFRPRRHGR